MLKGISPNFQKDYEYSGIFSYVGNRDTRSDDVMTSDRHAPVGPSPDRGKCRLVLVDLRSYSIVDRLHMHMHGILW